MMCNPLSVSTMPLISPGFKPNAEKSEKINFKFVSIYAWKHVELTKRLFNIC